MEEGDIVPSLSADVELAEAARSRHDNAKPGDGGEGGTHRQWIMSVRLVLSICIVWYHNNRMADSYKHNIMLPRPPGNAGDPERWVQSLIKQTQRSILQAGLNLFCIVAGTSLCLSMIRRRSVGSIVVERVKKLLGGFLFGLLVVAIPCNLVLSYCAHIAKYDSAPPLIEHLFTWSPALLNPEHLTFLPYLLILTLVHIPYLFGLLHLYEANADAQSVDGRPLSLPTKPSRLHFTLRAFSVACALYCLALVVILQEREWMLWALLATVLLAILSPAGIASIPRAWNTVVSNLHRQVNVVLSHPPARCSKSAMVFSLAYTAFIPIAFVFASDRLLPELQLPSAPLLLLYLVAPLCSIACPLRVRPLQSLPNFIVNTSWLALVLIPLANVLFLGTPAVSPGLVGEGPSTIAFFNRVFPDAVNEIITDKRAWSYIVMLLSHSAFMLHGFLWMLTERNIPVLPEGNGLVAVALCVIAIFFGNAALSNISSDFFYATAGFVTYHQIRPRACFAVGSWVWVCACLGYLKRYGNESYEGPGVTKKIMRFLSDCSFPTILAHPLFGYIVGCFIREYLPHLAYGAQVTLVHLSVYPLCALFTFLVARVTWLRALLGIKYM